MMSWVMGLHSGCPRSAAQGCLRWKRRAVASDCGALCLAGLVHALCLGSCEVAGFGVLVDRLSAKGLGGLHAASCHAILRVDKLDMPSLHLRVVFLWCVAQSGFDLIDLVTERIGLRPRR
jgi:hypothetical protein